MVSWGISWSTQPSQETVCKKQPGCREQAGSRQGQARTPGAPEVLQVCFLVAGGIKQVSLNGVISLSLRNIESIGHKQRYLTPQCLGWDLGKGLRRRELGAVALLWRKSARALYTGDE